MSYPKEKKRKTFTLSDFARKEINLLAKQRSIPTDQPQGQQQDSVIPQKKFNINDLTRDSVPENNVMTNPGINRSNVYLGGDDFNQRLRTIPTEQNIQENTIGKTVYNNDELTPVPTNVNRSGLGRNINYKNPEFTQGSRTRPFQSVIEGFTGNVLKNPVNATINAVGNTLDAGADYLKKNLPKSLQPKLLKDYNNPLDFFVADAIRETENKRPEDTYLDVIANNYSQARVLDIFKALGIDKSKADLYRDELRLEKLSPEKKLVGEAANLAGVLGKFGTISKYIAEPLTEKIIHSKFFERQLRGFAEKYGYDLAAKMIPVTQKVIRENITFASPSVLEGLTDVSNGKMDFEQYTKNVLSSVGLATAFSLNKYDRETGNFFNNLDNILKKDAGLYNKAIDTYRNEYFKKFAKGTLYDATVPGLTTQALNIAFGDNVDPNQFGKDALLFTLFRTLKYKHPRKVKPEDLGYKQPEEPDRNIPKQPEEPIKPAPVEVKPKEIKITNEPKPKGITISADPYAELQFKKELNRVNQDFKEKKNKEIIPEITNPSLLNTLSQTVKSKVEQLNEAIRDHNKQFEVTKPTIKPKSDIRISQLEEINKQINSLIQTKGNPKRIEKLKEQRDILEKSIADNPIETSPADTEPIKQKTTNGKELKPDIPKSEEVTIRKDNNSNKFLTKEDLQQDAVMSRDANGEPTKLTYRDKKGNILIGYHKYGGTNGTTKTQPFYIYGTANTFSTLSQAIDFLNKSVEPKEDKPESKLKPSSKRKIIDIPLSELNTDENRFQNRDNKFSEESVNRIVENFDERKLQPIVIWTDPAINKKYILSGHSRTEAIRRLNKKTIPAEEFKGTETEAIEYARNSNSLSTPETLLERAKYYADLRKQGKPESEIRKEAKTNENDNSKSILALSFLNPNGKTIDGYKKLIKSTDVKTKGNIETIAVWIGEARREHSQLTNQHENEMFEYLMDNKNYENIRNKTFWLDRIGKKVLDAYFNPDEPLNLKDAVVKSPSDIAKEAELKSLANEKLEQLNLLNKRENALLDMGKVKGENDFNNDPQIEQIKKVIKRIENDIIKIRQRNTGGDLLMFQKSLPGQPKRGPKQMFVFSKESSQGEANQKELVKILQKAFPNYKDDSVIFLSEQELKDKADDLGISSQLIERGIPLGFIGKDGKVYINTDKARLDTPIHEFAHIFNTTIKRDNRKLWNVGINLAMQDAKLVNEIRANYPELEGEALFDEILATAIGRKGAKMYSDINDAEKKASLLRRFTNWLKTLWDKIKSAFGNKLNTDKINENSTLEDFLTAVSKDFFSGKKVSDIKPEEVADVRMSAINKNVTEFYSPLEKIIESAKQEKFNATDFLNWVMNQKGFKLNELEGIGLDKFLADKKTITKAELLDYVKANKVEVKEKVLTTDVYLPKIKWETSITGSEIAFDNKTKDELAAIKPLRHEGELTEWMPYFFDEENSYQESFDNLQDAKYYVKNTLESKARKKSDTKYFEYTLPGEKSNYREVLITMPTERSKIYQRRSELAKLDSERPLTDIEQSEYDDLQKKWKKDQGSFQSSHFDEPNIVAHLRIDDRVAGDDNILFIEEIQSDWNLAGKKLGFAKEAEPADKGMLDYAKRRLEETKTKFDNIHYELAEKYNLNPAHNIAMYKDIRGISKPEYDKYNDLQHDYIAAKEDYESLTNPKTFGVPDMPFKNNKWQELAIKKAIQIAVAEGHDGIAFINGEQTAERYDLSKQVKNIKWITGNYKAIAITTINLDLIRVAITEQGKILDNENNRKVPKEWIGKTIDEIIGKDIAQKILESNSGVLEGKNLKTEVVWAKNLYDRQIPNLVKEYAKKLGGEVTEYELKLMTDSSTEYVNKQFGLKITPEMRKKVGIEGLPMFQKALPVESKEFKKWFGDSGVKKEMPATTQEKQQSAVKKEVSEGLAKAVDGFRRSVDQIKKILAPSARSEESMITAQVMTEKFAKAERKRAIAEESFRELSKTFDKQSNEKNLELIDAIETGKELTDKNERYFANMMRDMLDKEYAKVMKRKGTSHFIENYFPHIWERGQQDAAKKIFARRPLEGSKSFLKHRTIPTTKEGIDAGLIPVSYNPVELTLLKLHEIRKFNTAHEILDELKARGMVKFIPIDYNAPAGWKKIDDKIGVIYGDPNTYAQEHVDKLQYEALEKLAEDIGVIHTRKAKLGGKMLGVAYPALRTIATKYATPEDILAHEIGHQLDYKFGLWNYLTGNIHVEGKNKTDTQKKTRQLRVNIHKEIRAIADLRAENQKISKSYKAYLRNKYEKMAAVLQAYIHVPEKMKNVAPTIFANFEEFINSNPVLKQIKNIKPSIVPKGLDMKFEKKGILTVGNYYMPDTAADVINNHLSPGYRGKVFYDMFRQLSNTMNQVQLGMSLFHATFTSIDANISKVALGFQKIAEGKPLKGLFDIATSPFAFITNPIHGRDFRKDYLKENPDNPALVEAIERSGGRIAMDTFYFNDLWKTVKKNFKQQKYIAGTAKAPFAMFEQLSKPVLELLVPRQKLGVFSDMARNILENEQKEIDKLGTADAYSEEKELIKQKYTKLLQEAWRSVDNRLGQLVYDNLYWNRKVKDIAMIMVRSVGWNLGTFRELGGGVVDIPKLITEKRLSPRTAYTLALPIVTGLIGLVYNYLNGEDPENVKDLYFPKTGKVNKDGTPDRIAIPSYVKDIYAYKENPLRTLSHKVHPAVSTLIDIINNHDYYGTEISEAVPFSPEWFADEATYIVKQFRPFTVSNIVEMNKQGEDYGKQLQSFFGFQYAPAYIRRSAIQNEIYETFQKRYGGEITSQETAETNKLKSELKNLLKNDPDSYEIESEKALKEGKLTERQLNSLDDTTPSDIKLFKGLPAEDKLKIWEKMNQQEKDRYLEGLNNEIRETLKLPLKPKNRKKQRK